MSDCRVVPGFPGQLLLTLSLFLLGHTPNVDGALLEPAATPQLSATELQAHCFSCSRVFCSKPATGAQKRLTLLEQHRWQNCASSCQHLRQEPGCPRGIDRLPPTPYPPPPPPPVPAPLWAGDLRSKGLPMMPTPTPPGPPPPPPPPLPVVPLPDWSKLGVRFLPKLTMPKGPVDETHDLDYQGNSIPRPGASLLARYVSTRLVEFGGDA